MFYFRVSFLLLVVICTASGQEVGTSPKPQNAPSLTPTYSQPQPHDNSPTYSEVMPYPTYQGYPEYAYAPYPVHKQDSTVVKTLGTILPVVKQGLLTVLRIIGKVGLVLLGGAVFLLVGGAFTAAICAVTPICTLTFMGYGLSKETVRSMISPDNISMATNLVHEAIDKYQKLQNTVGV